MFLSSLIAYETADLQIWISLPWKAMRIYQKFPPAVAILLLETSGWLVSY